MTLPLALLAPLLAAAPASLLLAGAVERIEIPASGPRPQLRLDAITGEVVLAPVARGRIRPGKLCAALARQGRTLTLRCSSRSLEARLVEAPGRRWIELRELRGTPFQGDEAPPIVPVPPEELGAPGSCPGETPAARGECALAAGDLAAARSSFLVARHGVDRFHATLRLGDLALLAGDAQGAAQLWQTVRAGEFAGRLASTRLCDLGAECPDQLWDTTGLPPSMKVDMLLRHARFLAHRGRAAVAARLLLTQGERACVVADHLCRRILLAALRDARGEERADALALYVELPGRHAGPLAPELARAAAATAASLGAPVFGANVLSATSEVTPRAQLDEHLARAAELYLEGSDQVRAQVILDYARAQLPRRALASARWRAIAARSHPTASRERPEEPRIPENPGELQEAMEAIARARGDGTGLAEDAAR